MKISKYGVKYDVTTKVDPEWNSYDKTVASVHLDNYGKIYVDEYGQPIDNEYDLESIMSI